MRRETVTRLVKSLAVLDLLTTMFTPRSLARCKRVNDVDLVAAQMMREHSLDDIAGKRLRIHLQPIARYPIAISATGPSGYLAR